jgi:signal transduction histidine kinase
MRMLSIRQWMIVGMLLFAALAVLFFHAADSLDQRVLHLSTRQSAENSARLDTAERTIAANPDLWRDPGWQDATRQTLGTLGIGAVIRDASGAEIFRTGTTASNWRASREETIVERGQQLGSMSLFAPFRPNPFAGVAAWLAVLLALLFVRWQMGRYMVRPLEAMGHAARKIAGGDLDFSIPRSRVREVANVRDAFEAMGAGLRASIARQAELEEERRFFVGAIAHDLRTPLFALRGSLVGLEQGLADSPEKAAWYIAVCRQKADQLDRLVNDLFTYTKAEYLEQALHREYLELGPLLTRVAEDARPRATAADITIRLAGPDTGCTVEGDAHLLERAVENLLDNALHHTPAGGTITVRWEVGESGSREVGRSEASLRLSPTAHRLPAATFTVADTGPGIAARDLPHLFDPLYRAEESRNRETGGAGLGLTIARRILRAHGGDLTAANGPSGGAEFHGWLPLSRAETPSAITGPANGAIPEPDGAQIGKHASV